MKLVLAIGVLCVVSGCSSAPRSTAETDLRQKLTIECFASNVLPSGCTREHEISIVTTLTPDNRPLPSVEDFRAQQDVPETY